MMRSRDGCGSDSIAVATGRAWSEDQGRSIAPDSAELALSRLAACLRQGQRQATLAGRNVYLHQRPCFVREASLRPSPFRIDAKLAKMKGVVHLPFRFTLLWRKVVREYPYRL